jgi:D-psicose/D-tagatose/L-ribulose 3-epimerase
MLLLSCIAQQYTPMTLGINTYLFTSPFTTVSTSLFPLFKKWGYDAVEIALEDPSHINASTVKNALEHNGLTCCSMCAALGPGRDLRGSLKEQRSALDYLYQLLDNSATVGAPVLIGPLYSSVGRAEMTEEAEYKRQWDLVAGHLSSLSSRAEKMNITLAIEPLNRYETDFINTCAQAMKMVNHVNNKALTVLLDSYHMNIEEKDPANAIRMAGTSLGHFHACGCDRGTPGNDHINWIAIKDALASISYNKAIVIESFTKDVKVIAKAASIWRKFEPSTEDIAVNGLRFLKSLFNQR